MIRIRILGPGGSIVYSASLETINVTPGMTRRFLWSGLMALVETHRKTPPALVTKLEIEVDRHSSSDDELSITTKRTSELPEGFERYRHERYRHER